MVDRDSDDVVDAADMFPAPDDGGASTFHVDCRAARLALRDVLDQLPSVRHLDVDGETLAGIASLVGLAGLNTVVCHLSDARWVHMADAVRERVESRLRGEQGRRQDRFGVTSRAIRLHRAMLVNDVDAMVDASLDLLVTYDLRRLMPKAASMVEQTIKRFSSTTPSERQFAVIFGGLADREAARFVGGCAVGIRSSLDRFRNSATAVAAQAAS